MIVECSNVSPFATFVQKTNGGLVGWELQEDEYDYQQEIARSSYADMLHDYDRNQKYYVALKKAIAIKHALGQKAHVLDIGTGTGLLSMMAANCGADSIVACEGFPPIAEVARKVIADNKFSDRIKVVAKRSTELKVGPGLDLEHRANILVTEVFDTELIGEGAVETFNHANENLLEADSIVVPWSSDVYAVALDSNMLSSFNRIRSEFPVDAERSGDDISVSVRLPKTMTDCAGNAGVHDLQVSQIPINEMTLLSEPLKVFKFAFFKPITANESRLVQFKALHSGMCNVVVMYWTLDMDQDGATVVSCSPKWVEPSPWRDHWMQAVYHLKNPIYVKQGDHLELIAKHDQYSMWFDVHKADDPYDAETLQMPACSCGLHGIASRTRLYAINDTVRWGKYIKILKSVKKNANVLYIGDTSLLPVAVAKLGAKKVYCVESSSLSYSVMSDIMAANGLNKDDFVILKEYSKKIDCDIDVVIAEPFFHNVLYPWGNLRFRYLAAELAPNARILPGKMRLLAVPMEFEHLHKIRAPLGEVEGFKMASFDQLIASARRRSDADIDVQPVFEYPGKQLSPPKVIYEIPLDSTPATILKTSGTFQIENEGQFHGIVLWAEWDFDGETVSTGLLDSGKWDLGSRQAVSFVEQSYKVLPSDTFDYDLTISLDGDDTGILRLSRPLC